MSGSDWSLAGNEEWSGAGVLVQSSEGCPEKKIRISENEWNPLSSSLPSLSSAEWCAPQIVVVKKSILWREMRLQKIYYDIKVTSVQFLYLIYSRLSLSSLSVIMLALLLASAHFISSQQALFIWFTNKIVHYVCSWCSFIVTAGPYKAIHC